MFMKFSCHRYAGLESRKSGKAKTTPAHQGKFPSAPPSPFASAFSARSVKGRYAFRSASLHCTLDFTARLRPTRHTMAAPGEISFPSRRYQKARNSRKTTTQLPSSALSSTDLCFPGTACPLFADGSDACRVSAMRFPPPRSLLSSIGVWACPVCVSRFPKGCLFVPRHPGGPAYPTYIRAAALLTLGLARGFAPSNPARPAKAPGGPKAKGGRAMKKAAARTSGVLVRLHPEEKELLRLNAGLYGLSVSDYVRRNCLSFHLRKSPMEKERLRQLARIGANLNQIARWANTHKRAVETVEVLTALASLERTVGAFMAAEESDAENVEGAP